jgi:hypothetical protein
MYNFNYEYMTFLYAVHVYMFCNVVLYCIALPARVFYYKIYKHSLTSTSFDTTALLIYRHLYFLSP